MAVFFPEDTEWWWRLMEDQGPDLEDDGDPGDPEESAYTWVSLDPEEEAEAEAEAREMMDVLFHPSPASLADPASTEARHRLLRQALTRGLLTPEQARAAGLPI